MSKFFQAGYEKDNLELIIQLILMLHLHELSLRWTHAPPIFCTVLMAGDLTDTLWNTSEECFFHGMEHQEGKWWRKTRETLFICPIDHCTSDCKTGFSNFSWNGSRVRVKLRSSLKVLLVTRYIVLSSGQILLYRNICRPKTGSPSLWEMHFYGL